MTTVVFLFRLLSMPTNKPIKLKSKHKMIALAFQKNQQKKGRKLSLDFHTSHDDPLGGSTTYITPCFNILMHLKICLARFVKLSTREAALNFI